MHRKKIQIPIFLLIILGCVFFQYREKPKRQTHKSILLQKKYTELHKKLAQTYTNANFLETTLELICLADSL